MGELRRLQRGGDIKLGLIGWVGVCQIKKREDWEFQTKQNICPKAWKVSPIPLQLVKVRSLSCVRLSATPWAVAYQVPPSMGFSKQESWTGLPFSKVLRGHDLKLDLSILLC